MSMTLFPLGKAQRVHTTLSVDVKKALDTRAKALNVDQCVILNSILRRELLSAGTAK